MNAIVRLATIYDLKRIYEHDQRHVLESGVDGAPIFSPLEVPSPDDTLDGFYEAKKDVIDRPATEVGWERIFIVTDETRVYGVLRLVHAPRLPTSLHRALLMMGLEASHRGGGYGSKLMEAAISWAREQGLSWIQLFVFENNTPARGLYKKFGFIEAGLIPDLFRVHGQIINDIPMVLRLR